MRDPIRLKLEYLASTYGIERLGAVTVIENPDGTRTLVLEEVQPGDEWAFPELD